MGSFTDRMASVSRCRSHRRDAVPASPDAWHDDDVVTGKLISAAG